MNTSTPTLGIIGGFGPETSAAFCVTMIRHAQGMHPAQPPAFAMDCVSVSPSLSSAAINGSREAAATVVEVVNESIRRLCALGVQTVALPCNTLHLFADTFQLPPSVRLLHIVDEVMDELQEQRIRSVGLLGTQLTVASGLYADRCAQTGIICRTPSENLQCSLNDNIAYFVDTGTVAPDAASTFAAAFEEFRRQGVSTAVLACTDLGGMMERCGFVPSVPCIDSMDVLARACARLCRPFQPPL